MVIETILLFYQMIRCFLVKMVIYFTAGERTILQVPELTQT